MWVFIARRLLWLPFLLLFVSLITFALGRFGPGDPVEVMLGAKYSPEAAERLRKTLGLDRPFFVQYADYVWGVLRGDFGESLRYRGRSVASLLGSKLWVTAQVNLAALLISTSIGIPLGFWIAHRQGRWEDPATVTATLVLMSIPTMVSVPFLLWIFCLKLGWLPCSGWGGFFDPRIVVPALALGVPGIASLTRLMRASTLDVLGQDFIRTAYAKGLSPVVVDARHVFRNALIPIVTVMTFALAGLLGGSFIVETILGLPGVGRLAVEAIFQRDYPVIMAITLIGAGVFVIANLVADIAYAFIDPRIRYQ